MEIAPEFWPSPHRVIVGTVGNGGGEIDLELPILQVVQIKKIMELMGITSAFNQQSHRVNLDRGYLIIQSWIPTLYWKWCKW